MQLTDIIDNAARKYPHKIALQREGESLTYAALLKRINRLASALVGEGVKKGDNIALISTNCFAYLEIIFACSRIGAVPVLMNPGLAPQVIAQLLRQVNTHLAFCSYHKEAFAHLCAELEALEEGALEGSALEGGMTEGGVLDGGALEGSMTEGGVLEGGVPARANADAGTPIKNMRFVLMSTQSPKPATPAGAPAGAALADAPAGAPTGAAPAGAPAATTTFPHYYEEFLTACEPYEPRPIWEPNDSALMLLTSGTTGMPKGVLHSHEAVILQVMASAIEGRVQHEERVLCVLPLFHTTIIAVLQVLYVGAELTLGASPKAEEIVRAVLKHHITRVTLVPSLIRRLVNYMEAHAVALPSLKFINYGAEPMSVELMEKCQQLFSCGFHEGYGMTETMATITTLLPEQHLNPKNLKTVGKPCFGVTLKVVDEQGNEVAPGERGELVVKSRTLMKGYWNNPEKTAEVVHDGWYKTGDIGFIDDEGFVSLIDRRNNMIISGGENVYPLEVKRCIQNLTHAINDVEVIGWPSKEWGEILIAAVVPKTLQGTKDQVSMTKQDVVDYCGQCLASYKKPKEVYFLPEIPRGGTGKVLTEDLRKLIGALRSQDGKE